MQGREIKLGVMLEGLIERGGYSRNRRGILDAVGVSAAALSQYVRGQTRPSFQKLVALADFFGVSLDYLVYGEPSGTLVDHGPLARYVDHALREAQARASRHSTLTARIGRVLADRVDSVAAELAESTTAAREGLIQDDETLRVESYCQSVDILTINLAFNVIKMPDGDAAAGQFLQVVAANLDKGCKYRFLLPGGGEDHVQVVASFRSLLAAHIGPDHVHQNCTFRRTDQPVMAGVALYRLNVAELQRKEPALFAQIADYLDVQHRLAYLISPNVDSNADMLMSGRHVVRAREAFESLWLGGVGL